MARSNPCYYIAPSAISVTPNANDSASDLAVHVTKGTKIKVFSKGISGLGWNDSTVQQWTLAGRNRRLTQSDKPYTIYARLKKNDKSDAYLIFAPKVADGDKWLDKYSYVTLGGLATGTANKNSNDYWYVKLGDVSLPANDQRTVTLDTGILGTDEFNTQWNLDPDAMPLRVELSATIDGVDAGDKPYVKWGKELILRAKLLEGWADTDVQRFHHWTIQRNTGNSAADKAWNFPYSTSDAKKPSSGRLVPNGNIALSHARGEGDMFGGAVSSTWTVTAWGLPQPKESDFTSDSSSASSSASSSNSSNSSNSSSASDSSKGSSSAKDTTAYEKLAEGTINILAETVEQFALELSTGMVNYDPSSDTYNPIGGVDVTVRATDQKGDVFKMTNAQLKAASLGVQFIVATLDKWNICTFKGADEEVAKTNIPIEAFHTQQNVYVRIVKITVTKVSESSSASSSAGEASNKTIETYQELYRTPIAFVRNGEDSKEREWIFLRSETAISFSDDAKDTTKPLIPSLIAGGEVKPEEAATGDDTNKNQDGWVPQGWWDDMQGTDSKYHYEYAAYRDYIKSSDMASSSASSKGESSSDSSKGASSSASSKGASSSANAAQRGGHWGDFSTPRIWSYYAEDAVSYRCRWTLAGVEVYQLKCAYTGAFRGMLPLVATLMKRVGSGGEQEVTGEAVIVVSCDGIDFSKTLKAKSPSFTIATDNAETKDFIQYLNNVALNALSVSFTVDGEEHKFSIPVIREADKDSVESTIDEYGSKKFLSKEHDDETKHKLTMGEAEVKGDASVGGNLKVHGKASLDSDAEIKGNASVGGDLSVTGKATTKDLLVTGTAHFFQLEIDSVKSSSGGRITSSADGFRVADVEQMGGNRIRVYWLAQDADGRAVMNMWKTGDQALSMSFNLGQIGADGKGQAVSNHYYWCLVTAVSPASTPVDRTVGGVTKKYNWIELSTETKAQNCTVNPAIGDDVVQLGHRGSDDPARQNAIYESSYVSLDPGLTPPLRANYRGITDFDLASHRCSYQDANTEVIDGSLKVLNEARDVITVKQRRNGLVTQSEPDVLDIVITSAYGTDVTRTYTLNAERDSGDTAADAQWNLSHKNIKSPLTITPSDLTNMGLAQSIFFTIKAVPGNSKKTTLTASVCEKLDTTRKFNIKFSSNRRVVYDDDVDMAITAHIMYGDDDYTDHFLADSRTTWTWTRDSGVEAEDNAWKPTIGASNNILLVEHHFNSNTSRMDCGSKWAERLHVLFHLEAKICLDSMPSGTSVAVTGTTGIGSNV